jgi:phosphoglycolate phosphatase-like HAD superfamily hydrolase
VLGALEFLNMAKERYLFFIASGTPQDELSDIVNTRGLTAYFTGIYGSPKTKPDIVKQIRSSYGFGNDEIVYVGDAQSDEDAARESGIVFIMRQKEPIGQKYRYWAIKNLFELDAVLRNIEKSFKSSATMR